MAGSHWRISVDAGACVSSGNCVALAGERFELTGEGARVLAEVIAPDDDVANAADACPMEAITVVDASDGSAVAP